MSHHDPLPAATLRRRCDPAAFSFESTASLPDQDLAIGQERAIESLEFGIGIRRDGYNLFALGPSGTGRLAFLLERIERAARREPAPHDWAYVMDFARPHRPKALKLPPGRATALARDVARLIEDLRVAIPAIFESEDYRARRQMIEERFEEREKSVFAEVNEKAAARAIAVIRSPIGVTLAPIRKGQVLGPTEFQELPEEDRKKIKSDIEELTSMLQERLRQVPSWEKERRQKIRELDRELTLYAIGHMIDDVRDAYRETPAALDHVEALKQDLLEHSHLFVGGDGGAPGEAEPDEPSSAAPGPFGEPNGPGALRRYRVNVLVDRGTASGAPVIHLDHPTQPNLVGRIEHVVQFGTLVTDFNLIKPGALHDANGGYLLIDAEQLLSQPLAWDELKRTIRSRSIRIESLEHALGITGTVTLDPEPIPFDAKVVLLGERKLYYLLSALDPEFDKLFKVALDFDDRVALTPESAERYARLAGTIARREGLLPADRGAVARLVEHASRLAGDAERISARLEDLRDALREADFQARRRPAAERIESGDVDRAVAAAVRRRDRIREGILEEIGRGTLRIETQGVAIGQVNGLSVIDLGTFAFGHPSRITARVRVGRGQLVDVEREVELGGPLHSKGVLILSGFLSSRYAPEAPLSLAASLVFEQSYGGVEGDSASLAEAAALLSALAATPIRQSFAVTGSVDQLGRVQAIGGVNEKIEGFFDACRARGGDGEHGVVIPAANVRHLMLRPDVVAAAAEGRFRVHAVETIDEAMEILTGAAAGERDASGLFPEGTLNRRVEERLASFARKAREHAAGGGGKETA